MDTASVKLIALQLSAMPPARARYLAAFAYLLGRAANTNLTVSDAETEETIKLMQEAGGLDGETARLVVVLATSQADAYGATEDFLVTREFKAISTIEEREQLLRCCFLVMAADDEIDETESLAGEPAGGGARHRAAGPQPHPRRVPREALERPQSGASPRTDGADPAGGMDG